MSRRSPGHLRAVLERRRSSAAGSHTSQRVRGREDRDAIDDWFTPNPFPCVCLAPSTYFGPDPFQSEIRGNHENVWLCDSCYTESARSI